MINEDYCSYGVAKLLNEKGFDEKVLAVYIYDNLFVKGENEIVNVADVPIILAPTHQMAMKWLRGKYNIYISIQPDFPSSKDYKLCWCWSANILYENCISLKGHQCYIETYEEAAETAIKYCLEHLI